MHPLRYFLLGAVASDPSFKNAQSPFRWDLRSRAQLCRVLDRTLLYIKLAGRSLKNPVSLPVFAGPAMNLLGSGENGSV